MHEQIASVRKTRAYLLELIKDLDTTALNTIPEGFNNNIIWNLGHLVAAQQGICYVRAGMAPKVDASVMAAFRPGSKPEAPVAPAVIEQIKSLLFTTLDQFEADYAAGLWQQYPAWSTRYGVELHSIEAATTFLLFHEGLHAGTIMALKRIVKPAVVAVNKYRLKKYSFYNGLCSSTGKAFSDSHY